MRLSVVWLVPLLVLAAVPAGLAEHVDCGEARSEEDRRHCEKRHEAYHERHGDCDGNASCERGGPHAHNASAADHDRSRNGSGEGRNGSAGPHGDPSRNETGNETARRPPCADAGGPEDRRACLAAYCEDHDHASCAAAPCSDRSGEAEQRCAAEHRCEAGGDRCAEQDRSHSHDEAFRHISFEPFDGHLGLEAYRVGGLLVLERASHDGSGPPEVQQRGRTYVADADGARLELHDNPTGLLRFKGDGVLALRFPADAVIQERGDSLHIDYGQRSGRLIADNRSVDGDIVRVERFASLHVSAQGSPADRGPEEGPEAQRHEQIERAKENRKVGAEVRLQRGAAPGEGAQVLAYDDLDVRVELPAEAATEATPLRVEVSANLTEGRTVVLDVDPAYLQGQELRVRYFDLFDVDGARIQEEVEIRQADSLEDILDPSDDDGPEYLVVMVPSTGAVQVLASIPTWSTHAITIASVGEFLSQPSVLIGVGAGLGGTLAAALAMFWRPRRSGAA